jgi:N-acetyl-gamma-glutamylphosphate reductase
MINKKIHIVIISFIIFILLNLIENLIHYNIGRHRDVPFIKISAPSLKDWIKIIATMILFGFLQGILTVYFI